MAKFGVGKCFKIKKKMNGFQNRAKTFLLIANYKNERKRYENERKRANKKSKNEQKRVKTR